MKCIHCSSDSRYKDRMSGHCPACKHPFAFEPKKDTVEGVPITDTLFKSAIDTVSGNNTVYFSERQLWWEFCRRIARRKQNQLTPSGCLVIILSLGLCVCGAGVAWPLILVGIAGAIGGAFLSRWQQRRKTPPPAVVFDWFQINYLNHWRRVHGEIERLALPEQVLPRAQKELPPPPDLTSYSFDRALITESDDIAAMLIANRFHFENNCAILSANGYPQVISRTVLEMLRRNPQLKVFVIHDASIDGCLLPRKLRGERWFPDPSVQIIDLGLRPRHAIRLKLLVDNGLTGQLPQELNETLAPDEVAWLRTGNRSALAALRPAKLMRAIYQGFARANALTSTADGGVMDPGFIWIHDGGADIHAADSFG